MSRAAGLCPRCSGPKRGRAARDCTPSITCHTCGDGVCTRHGFWTDGAYWCTKCANAAGVKKPRV